jgi:hypothetical protein
MNKIHPWLLTWDQKKKLQAARLEAKRAYERKYYAESEVRRNDNRNNYRKKVGIDLDSPILKPHNHSRLRKAKINETTPLPPQIHT